MDKFFLRSRTILGGLITAAPGISQALGWQVSAGELAEAGTALSSILDGAHAAIGLVMIWWGRNRAAGRVKLLPKVSA